MIKDLWTLLNMYGGDGLKLKCLNDGLYYYKNSFY